MQWQKGRSAANYVCLFRQRCRTSYRRAMKQKHNLHEILKRQYRWKRAHPAIPVIVHDGGGADAGNNTREIMDGAFIIMTEIEQENFLRAIETSLQVKRRHQFFLWTQGQLQPFIPHKILVCNVTRDGKGEHGR